MKRALIIGCGYTGRRLAERLLESGHDVVGSTRSEERARALESVGVTPLFGPLSAGENLRRVDRFGPHVVFYTVPPQTRDDPLVSILQATARAPLEAFVYASSTSVYGDRGGAWVDETDVPRPAGEVPRLRHAAERALVVGGWDLQTPTRICRIAGIYGPQRTLRRALERGEYVLIRGHDPWVNRIHIDDLVTALIAAWHEGEDGRVYNVTDDEPHRASQFAALAAELQGLARPQAVAEAEAGRRLGENRMRRKLSSARVRNRRLREDLRVRLRHPSYRLGLPAAVQAEKGTP